MSDVHLLSYGSDFLGFLHFLSTVKAKKIILNGDIIDLWQDKIQPRYRSEHINPIINVMARLGKSGKLIFVPGNHDWPFLPDLEERFEYGQVMKDDLGLIPEEKHTHIAADGKKYLVLHGHQFHNETFSRAVDAVHGYHNKKKHRPPYYDEKEKGSLGKAYEKIFHRVAASATFFNRKLHEELDLIEEDGIATGHTHHPVCRTREDGKIILNSGHFSLSHRSVLLEDDSGEFRLAYPPKVSQEDAMKAYHAFMGPDAEKEYQEFGESIEEIKNIITTKEFYLRASFAIELLRNHFRRQDRDKNVIHPKVLLNRII